MDTVLSVVVLTALGLVVGAVVLFRRGDSRKQAWLMLAAAAVMIANVLIWTWPQGGGTAAMHRAAQGGLQEP